MYPRSIRMKEMVKSFTGMVEVRMVRLLVSIVVEAQPSIFLRVRVHRSACHVVGSSPASYATVFSGCLGGTPTTTRLQESTQAFQDRRASRRVLIVSLLTFAPTQPSRTPPFASSRCKPKVPYKPLPDLSPSTKGGSSPIWILLLFGHRYVKKNAGYLIRIAFALTRRPILAM